ncbi:MAG TPA: DoxX family protein [Polyangiaceae bacterium]|nr:DoxX family protein [Polyangiaceae bacterium]
MTKSPNLIESAFNKGLELSKPIHFVGPLLARITLAGVFVSSGWGKVHNLEKVTAFFTELGIPAPGFQAVFVSNVELVCGALVGLGLLTRLASIPLICTMAVAILTAKLPELGGVVDLLGTSEFAYVAMLAWLVLAGPGSASLDALYVRMRNHNPNAQNSVDAHAA